MVLWGLVEEVPAPKSMATSPTRSNPLHNFTFPSPFLKWGTQRSIIFTSADDAGVSGSGDQRFAGSKTEESMATQKKESEPEKKHAVNARRSKWRRSGEDEDGVAAVRQKLTLDLKNQAHRLKEVILGNEEEPVKPWNMRKCKASIAAIVSMEGLKIHDHDDVDKNKPNCSSPAMTDNGVIELPKLRSNSEKVKMVKFHVELSKKEIEDDFVEMLGRRPPRRPNKRPKVVQKKLDDIFPGLWLTEITADRYKIVEKVRPSKKGKGSPSKKRKGSPSKKRKGKGSPSKKRKGKDK
ncbi:uncharacterized protein LOC133304616 [Gastrolobium bilobum]|uniref:uncharacterized protein LOC133304616 n=1 Tax=Gastrolobium bilobum TaxID=150636 RepID=UPI002AB247CF|nr:uncharacterized protein LOC133304616 [Gastrolobium bilobum]